MSPIIWRNICLDVPVRDISHAITMQVSIFGRGRDYLHKIMTWKVGASTPQRGTTICCCSQYNSASRHAILRYGQCVCALFFFHCSMPCPLKIRDYTLSHTQNAPQPSVAADVEECSTLTSAVLRSQQSYAFVQHLTYVLDLEHLRSAYLEFTQNMSKK